MARLAWDLAGEREFETGVEQAVLFVKEGVNYGVGEAWNGLTAVNETPSGAEPTKYYANNKVYLNILSPEEMGVTIEAYTYPDGWAACNGEKSPAPGLRISQQTRSQFGLVYKTLIGNDTESTNYGYKLHFLYDGLAGASERAYGTVNENKEPGTMSWEVSTTPVDIDEEGYEPSALATVSSLDVDAVKLKAIEDMIYGTDGATEGDAGTEPKMPTIDELITMLKPSAQG